MAVRTSGAISVESSWRYCWFRSGVCSGECEPRHARRLLLSTVFAGRSERCLVSTVSNRYAGLTLGGA